MQNREEANTKFASGNKIIAMQGIPNILKAIIFYKEALFHLRSISREEATEQDNKSIRDVQEAWLRGLNTLLRLSSNWSQVMDELERFLIFYVDSVRILNQTHQRLPGLDTLELKMDGPFTVLWAKTPSGPQRERLKNYMAVVSLFHEELATEKNHKLSSEDPIVIESFELYKNALKALEATVKPEHPVEDAPPPSEAAPIPPDAPQSSAMQKPKHTVIASSPPPRMSSAQHPRETKLRLFDYVAEDGPKRKRILELMERKEFVKALAGYHCIVNHIADDYRCACNCQLIIGEDHTRHSRFLDAITCYTEALNFCKHIRLDDVVEVDSMNIAKVFNAFVNTINQIIKSWAVNFSFASKCMAVFLNFYVDNFEALNSGNKKLLGLDELNMGCLMEYLIGTRDEISREKTRVYVTVIGMFRKGTVLENGELESLIAEIEIKKEMWDNESMSDAFDLFYKALALVKRIKGHVVLNPELNAQEPVHKRLRAGGSSSSSSLPAFSSK